MAWARSEYAGEMAVVSAWISALMPWSVTVPSPADAAFDFVVRYAYFLRQFLPNLASPGEATFLWIHEATTSSDRTCERLSWWRAPRRSRWR